MMSRPVFSAVRRLVAVVLVLGCAACAGTPTTSRTAGPSAQQMSMSLLPQRQEMAVNQAEAMRARGNRVWCVPFARALSGVELRGNAGTWWGKARGQYAQGHRPQVGAVMAFASTRKMPMGHVAVVSQIVSDRQIRIDHANWKRNRVSLGMSVIDISAKNDWSSVRVESQPGSLGRPYPINGFIYPGRPG